MNRLSNHARADFKNNEQAVFKKLQNLEEVTMKKEKKKDMNSAVDSTEAIRQWVSAKQKLTCVGGPHLGLGEIANNFANKHKGRLD